MSAFSFLFSEVVQYSQTKVSNISELEKRWASYQMLAAFQCVHVVCGGRLKAHKQVVKLSVQKHLQWHDVL